MVSEEFMNKETVDDMFRELGYYNPDYLRNHLRELYRQTFEGLVWSMITISEHNIIKEIRIDLWEGQRP